MLVVIVGRSGAGKSTFIEAMGMHRYHFVCSQPLIDRVKEAGLPLTHDAIFKVSQGLYDEDRLWMIPIFERELEKRGGTMIADGLRYPHELKELRKRCEVVVVRVDASPEERYRRLKKRGKISLATLEEFNRLEKDETESMNIGSVLSRADLVVPNHGTLKQLKSRAHLFARLLTTEV